MAAQEEWGGLTAAAQPIQTFCFAALESFAYCSMYVNINTEHCCYHKCNGEQEPDLVQASRPVAADSPAAVMIHLHTGKTRSCTQVLPPLVTPAASTNHAYTLYSETFAHNALTHTSMHADTR